MGVYIYTTTMAWLFEKIIGKTNYDPETLEGKRRALEEEAIELLTSPPSRTGTVQDTEDHLKKLGLMGRIREKIEVIDRELAETYPDMYIVIGTDSDGNPIYEKKPVWFTEKVLGREYAMGGLFSKRLPMPGGIATILTTIERETGAQLYSEVAGYDKKRYGLNKWAPWAMPAVARILESEIVYNTGALHRMGLIKGLQNFQIENGPRLIQAIAEDEKDPVAAVGQIEGCFEAASSNPDLAKALVEFAHMQQLGDFYAEQTQPFRDIHGPIAVPSADRFFPEITTAIDPKLPHWDPSGGLQKGFVDGFARLTYERCHLYLENRS